MVSDIFYNVLELYENKQLMLSYLIFLCNWFLQCWMFIYLSEFSDATIPRKYCETHFQPFENTSNDN